MGDENLQDLPGVLADLLQLLPVCLECAESAGVPTTSFETTRQQIQAAYEQARREPLAKQSQAAFLETRSSVKRLLADVKDAAPELQASDAANSRMLALVNVMERLLDKADSQCAAAVGAEPQFSIAAWRERAALALRTSWSVSELLTDLRKLLDQERDGPLQLLDRIEQVNSEIVSVLDDDMADLDEVRRRLEPGYSRKASGHRDFAEVSH